MRNLGRVKDANYNEGSHDTHTQEKYVNDMESGSYYHWNLWMKLLCSYVVVDLFRDSNSKYTKYEEGKIRDRILLRQNTVKSRVYS